MGEPMRRVLESAGTDDLLVIASGPEMGMPSRVREDRATEAEKDKIAAWLEDHYGMAVRDQIGEWGGHEERGADARELLDLVFGEEASRV